MPVPSDITELSTTAWTNSPSGGELPSTLDNYQRAHASFIAQLRAVIGGATDANIPTSWPTYGAVISQTGNSGTTAGTSTAYTLTPATAITGYSAKQTFWVTFHTASGAAPTLQISGIGTPPNLVRQDSTGAFVNIAANEIPTNHRSRVTLLSATQALVEDMPPAIDYLNSTRIDVASATTVNLTSSAPNTRHINITGTTTITGFTVAIGQCYFVRFNAVLTLTNNASIVTQTGANITTAEGDTCILRATAANVVEVLCYVTSVGGVLIVRDEKSSGTAGGTFTSGAWRTRDLNTVMINSITGGSLAANQITLPAGTYDINGYSVGYLCQGTQHGLYNVSDAEFTILGGSSRTGGGSNANGDFYPVNGRFTIASTKVFEIQGRCVLTCTTNGFGWPNSFGVNEVYSHYEIKQVI